MQTWAWKIHNQLKYLLHYQLSDNFFFFFSFLFLLPRVPNYKHYHFLNFPSICFLCNQTENSRKSTGLRRQKRSPGLRRWRWRRRGPGREGRRGTWKRQKPLDDSNRTAERTRSPPWRLTWKKNPSKYSNKSASESSPCATTSPITARFHYRASAIYTGVDMPVFYWY